MITSHLSPNSKIWIYQSNRFFTADESAQIREAVKIFAEQWTSHKVGVAGDGDLLHNLFVVLVADENVTGVSGCSIDSSVHFIRALEKKFDVSFFDRHLVAYQWNGELGMCTASELQQKIQAGILPASTMVFNNQITNLGQMATEWCIPFDKSWVKNFSMQENPLLKL